MNPHWEFFECQRCGRCCESLGLPTPEPIIDNDSSFEEIAEYLNETVESLIQKYYGSLDEGYIIPDDNKRKPCPFLRKEGEQAVCSIYQVRPSGCRNFPFNTMGGRCGINCPAHNIAIEKRLKRIKKVK